MQTQDGVRADAMGPIGGLVPHIVVDGADRAAAFYRAAFGAEELFRMKADDGKRLMHCHLRINGGSLMLCDCFPEYGGGIEPSSNFTMHLQVTDVDAWWSRAVAAGAEVKMPLQLQFWGDRYGQLRDPFGVQWALAEAVDRNAAPRAG